MPVYIEFVILDNMAVNAFLILLTLSVMRIRPRLWRVFLAAALGTAFAVAVPYMRFRGFFFVKCAVGLLMAAVMGNYARAGKFVGACALFFGFTFLLGGVVTGGLQMARPDWTAALSGGLTPFYVGVGAIVMLAIVRVAVNKLIVVRREARNVREIEIDVKQKKIRCRAYYDSGNRLYYKNRPVLIVDGTLARALEVDCGDGRGVEVDTVTGSRRLRVFRADRISFLSGGKSYENAVCAVSDAPLKPYGALLHCDM